eukprot:GHVU01083871.1.p1 GENE.GHVU01083871.1~~GHVU01083871.1.p1  ORF type:complete len:494 (-),score=95.27 GHVU01083871.1:1770-3251(-)
MSGYGLRPRTKSAVEDGGAVPASAPPAAGAAAELSRVSTVGTANSQTTEVAAATPADDPNSMSLSPATVLQSHELHEQLPSGPSGGVGDAAPVSTTPPTGAKLLEQMTPKEKKKRVSEELMGVTRADMTQDGDIWWVRGKKVDELTSHDARYVAAQVGCTGYSALKRVEVQQLLKSHVLAIQTGAAKYEEDGKAVKHRAVAEEDVAWGDSAAAASQIRLTNVMFHADIIQMLLQTGRVATRDDLDTGEVKTQKKLWKKVAKKYEDFDDASLAVIHYEEEGLREITRDPGEVQREEPEALKQMWCKLKKRYKKSKKNFTKSGTHASPFWEFCNGDLAIYNLHMHLQVHRDMLELVTDELPPGMRSQSTEAPVESAWGARKKAGGRLSAAASKPDQIAAALGEYTEVFGGEDARAAKRKRFELEEAKLQLEREALEQRRVQVAAEVQSAGFQQWREIDQLLKDKVAQLNLGGTKEEIADLQSDIKALKGRKATLL